MGKFSLELCGGTHVARTGDIGCFKIITEEGIAAGVRRVEALTADAALQWLHQRLGQIDHSCQLLNTTPDHLVEKIKMIQQDKRDLSRRYQQLVEDWIPHQFHRLLRETNTTKGVQWVIKQLDDLEIKWLRQLVEGVKTYQKPLVMLLVRVDRMGDRSKIQCVAGSNVKAVDARLLLDHVVAQIGGKSGGRPHMAQGGGHQIHLLQQALDSVLPWLSQRLA